MSHNDIQSLNWLVRNLLCPALQGFLEGKQADLGYPFDAHFKYTVFALTWQCDLKFDLVQEPKHVNTMQNYIHEFTAFYFWKVLTFHS